MIFLMFLVFFSAVRWVVAVPVADISKIIPSRQRYLIKAICLGDKARITFTLDVTVDNASGNILLNTGGNDVFFEGIYDSAMRLVKTHDTYQNQSMIRTQGYDRRETNRGADNRIFLNFYLNNQLIKSRQFIWDEQTLETNGLMIYLQALSIKGMPRLDASLLSRFRGDKYPVTIKLLTDEEITKIPVTEKFCELFGPAFLKEQKLLVYELSLAKVYGMLYPHKFYFAYQKDPLGQLSGCWGGVDIDEEYYRFEYIAP
jgi:hypothetical protein